MPVPTWGFNDYGGDSTLVASSLKSDVKTVYATNGAFAAVKNNGWALYCAAIRFRDNKEVVLTAIRNNPHALDYASDRLQDDRDIVKEACKMSALSFYFASRFIKSNRDLIKEEISLKNYEIFKHLQPSCNKKSNMHQK